MHLLEDLSNVQRITTRKDLSGLDHRGLRSLGKAMRNSVTLKEVTFESTKIDSWYHRMVAKGADGYANNAFQLDFCNVFCMNRSRLEKIRFTPALKIPRKAWSFGRALYLKEVWNGDEQVFSSTERTSELRQAVQADNYKRVFDLCKGSSEKEDDLEAQYAVRLDNWKALYAMLEVDPTRVTRDPIARKLVHIAASENAECCFQLLIECKARTDQVVDEYTPLEIASQHGSSKIVKLLLDNGEKAHNTFHSPLHEAAMANQLGICEMLIKGGAEANVKKWRGRTVLHYCADYGAPQIVKLLFNNAAELEAVDENNDTALTLSARRGTYLTLKSLIQVKANLHHRGMHDKTALEWSEEGDQSSRGAKLLLLEALAEADTSNKGFEKMVSKDESAGLLNSGP